MKTSNFRFTIVAVVFALLVVASAYAQSGTLYVSIPFQFMVGSTNFEPGEYTLDRVALASGMLLIQTADCRNSAIAITIPARSGNSDSKSKLIFHRHGDHYFLAEVWKAGNDVGRQLLKSRAEREWAKSAGARDLVVLFAHPPASSDAAQ